MRRSILLLCAIMAVCSELFSQAGPQTSVAQTQKNRKIVDFTAERMNTIKIGDSSVLNLVGNVVFYHNGAIITCDSAVRYNDKRMECFKNVVVNKQTTYIYGDRADYNGEINTAKIYSPIIKMVDKDATMYTYNFSFNTLSNIGQYSGGGTIKQKDNLLESDHGYYYSNKRDVICVGDVEINSPNYKIKSDSVGYNMDSEIATFFVKTYIWNSKGEILSADKGRYNQATSDYQFTANSYILTANKELWADSLDYNSVSENAILHRNIQLRDEEQKVMAFGDFGQYWGNPGDALLTQRPSLVSFDPKEDTLYVRSDSMFLYTVSRDFAIKSDSVAKVDTGEEELISATQTPQQKALKEGEDKSGLTSEVEQITTTQSNVPQSTIGAEESLDTGGAPPLSKQQKKELKQQKKALARQAKQAANVMKGNRITTSNDKPEHPIEQDSVEISMSNVAGSAVDSTSSATTKRPITVTGNTHTPKPTVASSTPNPKPTTTTTTTTTTTVAGNTPKPKPTQSDSTSTAKIGTIGTGIINGKTTLGPATLGKAQHAQADTSITTHVNFIATPQQAADSAMLAAPAQNEDSMQRIVKAYRNVRIFRNDVQAVCDSLIGFSIDSTMHLYINPVLWNENNQITSDVIDLYTKNKQLFKAIFTGTPMMCAEVDTTHYNQVKGKVIEAFFKENMIYRTDVNGNGQTYYYMTDDQTQEITTFFTVECADITFMITDKQIETIIYRNEPVYSLYPMDKIPPDQSQFLDGFSWEVKRKPSLKDVFDRTIRPTQRAYYESLHQPTYPLTDAIMRNKAGMIHADIWRERNDTISPLAYEFIRSLGY